MFSKDSTPYLFEFACYYGEDNVPPEPTKKIVLIYANNAGEGVATLKRLFPHHISDTIKNKTFE